MYEGSPSTVVSEKNALKSALLCTRLIKSSRQAGQTRDTFETCSKHSLSMRCKKKNTGHCCVCCFHPVFVNNVFQLYRLLLFQNIQVFWTRNCIRFLRVRSFRRYHRLDECVAIFVRTLQCALPSPPSIRYFNNRQKNIYIYLYTIVVVNNNSFIGIR